MTYPVRAVEHVNYEYFVLDMMIHRDKLLHIIFEFQLCICIFSVMIPQCLGPLLTLELNMYIFLAYHV